MKKTKKESKNKQRERSSNIKMAQTRLRKRQIKNEAQREQCNSIEADDREKQHINNGNSW